MINGQPVLLEAGVHFLNEPVFQIDQRSGFRRLDEEYIEMGPTKIVVVQRGCITSVHPASCSAGCAAGCSH